MQDPIPYIVIALSSLAAVAIIALTSLRGWNAWIDLKRMELARPAETPPVGTSTATRIEVADLKERIRKLEAIAAGVDL